ncbi:hypothetical protein Tco_1200869 [Tanacetum coccineum]
MFVLLLSYLSLATPWSDFKANVHPKVESRTKAKDKPCFHLVPYTKEDQEAKEDREAMSLVSDVAKKDITKTSVQTMGIKAVGIKFEATRKTLRIIKDRIKGTVRGITKHQPVLKEDAGHLAEYTAYVLKQQ